MSYSEEQIKKYLVILHNYTSPLKEEVSKKPKIMQKLPKR